MGRHLIHLHRQPSQHVEIIPVVFPPWLCYSSHAAYVGMYKIDLIHFWEVIARWMHEWSDFWNSSWSFDCSFADFPLPKRISSIFTALSICFLKWYLHYANLMDKLLFTQSIAPFYVRSYLSGSWTMAIHCGIGTLFTYGNWMVEW